MNYLELFEGEDVNDKSTFYLDESCTVPYTGHVEEYFNGKISWECDIVNGLRNGIEKEYYDDTGEIELVNEIENNVGNGLCVEYYKSGKIRSISIIVSDVNVDSYSYTENGEIENISIMNDEAIGINYSQIKDKIEVLRKKYNLNEINEEVLKYGKPFKHGKPIY